MNPEETVVRTTYPYSLATSIDAILDASCLELNRGLDHMLTTCLKRFDWFKIEAIKQTNQNSYSYDVVVLHAIFWQGFPAFFTQLAAVWRVYSEGDTPSSKVISDPSTANEIKNEVLSISGCRGPFGRDGW